MTREEAKRTLEFFSVCSENHVVVAVNARDRQALDMAIEALRREPCEDAVSRRDAVEALEKWESESVWDEWLYEHRNEPGCEPPSLIVKQLPSAQPDHVADGSTKVGMESKYEYHYDHTDCIWYRPEARNRCPSTCAQYRDGWNDAMQYIFRDGKGYRPYRRGEHYERSDR